MANEEIKHEAARHEVKLWEIADKLGYSDSYFSRKLRHELPPEEKAKVQQIIKDLATN